MKIAAFTTVFPSPMRPLLGLFVLERLRHAAVVDDVQVVAPIPWFLRASRTAAIRQRVEGQNLMVHHPTFWYLPRFMKHLDGALLCRSSIGFLKRLQAEWNFDLIDAHFGWPDGVAACMLGERFRTPVVTTLRGSELSWVKRPDVRRTMCRWLPRSTRVVAVSEELAALAVSLGVPLDHIDVIENGVDTGRFRPGDKVAARRELGYEPCGPLVVSVGHLVPGKGFHRLVEAFAHVAERQPAARLAIIGGTSAGTGDYPDRLRQLIASHGLQTKVTLPGSVTPRGVVRWLQASDLFALASEREGSPNVVREALACGRPVVSTDVGDVRRMVPAFAGILVPVDAPAAVIVSVLERALGAVWDEARIRRHAEQHDWGSVASRVHAVWAAAVRESRG